MAANPLAYCSSLLKRRLYSSFELDVRMKRRGFEEEDRQKALHILTENGLVDDLRFASAWVRTRDSLSPRGSSVLQQELLQKGVSKDIIQQVLQEKKTVDEEHELALRVIKAKERQYKHLEESVRKRRLMGVLARRGFSYGTIRRILDS